MDESLIAWPCTSSAYALWYTAVLHTCHTARALETGSGLWTGQYVRCISLAMLASQCTHLYDISGSVVRVTERVGGNSLFVALIDSESVAIARGVHSYTCCTDTRDRRF